MGIEYTRELDIRNIGNLPGGLKCNYLVCIEGHKTGVLIAKAWKRNQPTVLAEGEVLITFK